MQTLNELKYSQSVWGFQAGKAIIRKVCDVKDIFRKRIKQAFGFRDFKYFRLKIFDLPSTDIRKKL